MVLDFWVLVLGLGFRVFAFWVLVVEFRVKEP